MVKYFPSIQPLMYVKGMQFPLAKESVKNPKKATCWRCMGISLMGRFKRTQIATPKWLFLCGNSLRSSFYIKSCIIWVSKLGLV